MKGIYSKTIEWYDKNAEFYEKNSSVLLYRQLKYFTSLIKKGGRILDIGSGTGKDVNYFNNQGFKAIGIDASKKMINIAQKKYGNHYQLGNIIRFKYNQEFHGIWASSILTHIKNEDILKLIGKIKKSLYPGGALAIIVPYKSPGRPKRRKVIFNEFSMLKAKKIVYTLKINKIQVFTKHKRQWIYLVATK